MKSFSERIFVGVTCTASQRKKDHWKSQLKEINQLGITEISLFPTTLNRKDRKELYSLLE
jgi:hypothetical protein